MAAIKAPAGMRLLAVGERIPAHYQWYCFDEGIWLPGSGSDTDEFQGNSRMEYPHAVPIEKTSRKPPKVQETSRQALQSQATKAPTDCMTVWNRAKKYRTGITCDKLEQVLNMSHQTTSARIRDLVLVGKLVDSGRREKTRTGRPAICWKAVV